MEGTGWSAVSGNHIVLETSHDILGFNPDTAQLASFRTKAAPDQEFIVAQDGDPVFVIQFLDEDRRFRRVTSLDTADVDISSDARADGSAELTARFDRLGGMDVSATIAVRASPGDRFSTWSITVRNDEGLRITDVQFPYVVAS